MDLDHIDRAIIDHLQADGRLSNVALAEKVHLTPGPCLRRVQRLEAEGIIRGYAAQVDPAALGRSFKVILDLELSTYDHVTVERVESALRGFDEVVEMYRMFGTPDYFVRVAVADLEAYERFLTQQVMTLPGVSKVSSRFAMKELKSRSAASASAPPPASTSAGPRPSRDRRRTR